MIIIDLNQVMFSNLMQIPGLSGEKIEEDLLRHMVLNSIRANLSKHRNKYGSDVVIACDDKEYWRRAIFPYYKASRKKGRDAMGLDWDSIFKAMNNIREELKEFFPYRVIQITGAEADDIIGTLCKEVKEEILIISGDKDFIQLQRFPNVKQYDPIRKRFLDNPDPIRYLKEHILKGDGGDGIPNFLSDDNCFVVGTRQTPLRANKIEQWVTEGPEGSTDTRLIRNYQRNETLIDLTKIPERIQQEILNKYHEEANKPRNKMFNYFMTYKLKNLMESINEF